MKEEYSCDEDVLFMQHALNQAKKAFELDEVPVGAVLVYKGNILAEAHNCVELMQDATAHAEVLCIKKASRLIKSWRLLETTLYTTLEPCPMCFGSLILSRVSKVVYGASDLRHGACGSVVNLSQIKHPIHNIDVVGGVLAEESAKILKDFFREKRLKSSIG